MEGLHIRILSCMATPNSQVSKLFKWNSRFFEQEVEVALKDRVLVHTDSDLKQEAFEGKTLATTM